MNDIRGDDEKVTKGVVEEGVDVPVVVWTTLVGAWKDRDLIFSNKS